MSDFGSELAELAPDPAVKGGKGTGGGIGINVKRLLKLRGRIIALVFTLMVVPACVAIWMLVPAEFIATADLKFSQKESRLLDNGERSDTQRIYENHVNTQIQLLMGPAVISTVLKDPVIQALPVMAAMESGQFYFIKKNLLADQQKYTELVRVSFTHEDPTTATVIVNAVVHEYMRYTAEQELGQGGTTLNTLRDTLALLESRLKEQQTRINNLGDELQVPVGEVNVIASTKTQSLLEQHALAQADTTTAEVNVRKIANTIERVKGFIRLNKERPRTPIYDLDVETKIQTDPDVMLLSQRVSQVQQDYTLGRDLYVDDAPALRAKKQELDTLMEALEDLRMRVRTKVLNALQAQYHYDLQAAQSALEDATLRRETFFESLEGERVKSLDLAQKMAQIEDLRRQYRETLDERQRVNTQIFTVEVESQAPARVSLIGEATASDLPDKTRAIKYILLAIMGSMSAAVGLGVLLEYTDQNIRSQQDVAYVTDIPVLSTVPHVTEDRIPNDTNLATVTDDYPDSMTADQFRQIVARLLHWLTRGREVKSCAIVSPSHGDGKTTLACNVAIALAQADRRVLLVDLNARRPAVEANFGLTPVEGLAEMLSGDRLARDPDRETEFKNLFVLGPGLQLSGLVERLASKEMSDFLEGAERLFDNVILDTPASLLSSESKMIAPRVDGVLLVVGAGVSSFGMLRRCIDSMEEAGAGILGIVINGVRHAPGGYLRRNLKAYYEGSPKMSARRQRATSKRSHQSDKESPDKDVLVSVRKNGDEEV